MERRNKERLEDAREIDKKNGAEQGVIRTQSKKIN